MKLRNLWNVLAAIGFAVAFVYSDGVFAEKRSNGGSKETEQNPCQKQFDLLESREWTSSETGNKIVFDGVRYIIKKKNGTTSRHAYTKFYSGPLECNIKIMMLEHDPPECRSSWIIVSIDSLTSAGGILGRPSHVKNEASCFLDKSLGKEVCAQTLYSPSYKDIIDHKTYDCLESRWSLSLHD